MRYFKIFLFAAVIISVTSSYASSNFKNLWNDSGWMKSDFVIVVFPNKKSTNKNISPAAARIILLTNFNNEGDFLFPHKGTIIEASGCDFSLLYPAQIL